MPVRIYSKWYHDVLLMATQTWTTNIENSMRFLRKQTNKRSTYDSATPLLGMLAKEMEAPHERMHSHVYYIVIHFIKVKIWNKPRCLSIDDNRKKLWYLHSME